MLKRVEAFQTRLGSNRTHIQGDWVFSLSFCFMLMRNSAWKFLSKLNLSTNSKGKDFSREMTHI